ncbi:MAG: methyltransferase [Thermoplasmatota archaeon]
MNRLIFELAGPNFYLAEAEVKAVFEGSEYSYYSPISFQGIFSLKTEVDPIVIGKRLGLTHRLLSHGQVTTQEDINNKNFDINIPEGTAAVRTRRISGTKADTIKIKKFIGDIVSKKNKIDLDNPDHELLALISDKCAVGKIIYETDKDKFKSREVKNRPFFSPISLEPKYARAMINLARVKKGDRIHDPFCGTGGILIEGALMNFSMTGGDIDSDMVQGCKTNLKKFGCRGEIKKGDVSETIPDKIDAVVTDPPYGRASTTSGEDKEEIYKRLFRTCENRLKDGGYLSTIFPDKKYYKMGKDFLEPIERYKVMVHGSLDRHFCVFSK